MALRMTKDRKKGRVTGVRFRVETVGNGLVASFGEFDGHSPAKQLVAHDAQSMKDVLSEELERLVDGILDLNQPTTKKCVDCPFDDVDEL